MSLAISNAAREAGVHIATNTEVFSLVYSFYLFDLCFFGFSIIYSHFTIHLDFGNCAIYLVDDIILIRCGVLGT